MKYAENFSFAKIFTSHMVLQREKKILFYGKADPGCGILLTVAGKSFSAVADDRGKWFCQLQPLTETGPFEVVLKGSDNVPEVKLEDVVAGEVWLCAGQSNMQMPIGGDDPFFRTEDPEAILAGANQPQIRLFNYVPEFHLSPDSPDEDFSGDVSWQVCSAQTAENFSACGYFFGKQLQSDLQVPIGLISAPLWQNHACSFA